MEQDDNFDEVLFQAAAQGDISTLQLMYKTDQMWQLKVNSRNHLGDSALRTAAKGGHCTCVAFLIMCGADINIIDVKAQTPLVLATTQMHADCMEQLLQAGCDPDGNVRNLMSPLYYAAMMGFENGIKLLFECGAILYNRCDDTNRLPWEIDHNSKAAVIHAAQYLMKLSETPRILKSQCRLVIRQMLGRHRVKHINDLPLPLTLIEYLDLQDT